MGSKCPNKLTWIAVDKSCPIGLLTYSLLYFRFVDVNECSILGIGDHKCINTEGSYKCSCVEGYVFEPPRTCRPQGNGSCLDCDLHCGKRTVISLDCLLLQEARNHGYY